MATKRLYQSSAAKRKAKKQRVESEAKGKWTLEEFDWKVIVRPSGEQDSEIFVLLDTGSGLSVLPTAQTVSTDTDIADEGPSTSSSGIAMSSSDPATSKNLSNMQRENIVISGPPANPSSFPCDSYGRCFPESVFYNTLQNGEKAYVDWFVWSQSINRLFCFPCCLFHRNGKQHLSRFSSSDADIKDNWSKL